MSQDLFTMLDRAAADADVIRLSVDAMIRSGRRRRMRVAAAVASAATATAGVVAAGASLLPAPPATTTTAHAGAGPAAVAAPAAAAASVAACLAAPYWYTKSQYHESGKVIPREIWLGQTGAGRLSDSTKSGSLDEPGSFGVFSWQQLCTLTTDVPTLYSTLRTDAGDAGADKESETFVEVGDLLRESPAPLGVRLALLDVAAMVPGVEVTADVHDSLGRLVTRVSRVQGGGQGRLTYLIDPTTGELLEENEGGWIETYLASGSVPDTTSVVSSSVASMTAQQ